MGDLNIYLVMIFVLIFLILLFLIFRETVCWYFKINERMKNENIIMTQNSTMIRLLDNMKEEMKKQNLDRIIEKENKEEKEL